jgi:murein DD-endopeptidase MepM/ murein hydrolase activator NlpD
VLKIFAVSLFAFATLGPLGVGPTKGSVSGAVPSAGSNWQLPFDSPHRLVRQYLQPASDYSAGHRGVDYEVELGESLLAPADGVISVARVIVNRGILAIKHGSGLVTEFEPACSELEVGRSVKKGEVIGWACEAGETYSQHCSDDACVHFSLRLEGKYLSPLALIGGLNPSRLLPYARG